MSRARWSFYDPVTGLFSARVFQGNERLLARNTPRGLIAIRGTFDRLTQRVDIATGQIVAYERPTAEVEAEQFAIRARQTLQRIDALERAQWRPQRELSLDPNNAEARRRLAEIEAEIVTLRKDIARA